MNIQIQWIKNVSQAIGRGDGPVMSETFKVSG